MLLLHLNGMTTLHFDDYSLRDSSQRFTPTTLLFVSLSPLRDHHSDTEATSLSPYQRCHHNNDEHRGNSVALPFTATLDVALSFTTVSRAAVWDATFVATMYLLNETPLLWDSTVSCCVHRYNCRGLGNGGFENGSDHCKALIFGVLSAVLMLLLVLWWWWCLCY